MAVCNCLFWALLKVLTEGGKIHFSKSRTWFGFHVTWIDRAGIEWEYTLEKPVKHKWWYIPFCYKGVVKRVYERETKEND